LRSFVYPNGTEESGVAAFRLAGAGLGPDDIAKFQGGVMLHGGAGALRVCVYRAYEGAAVAVAMGGASALPDDENFAVGCDGAHCAGSADWPGFP